MDFGDVLWALGGVLIVGILLIDRFFERKKKYMDGLMNNIDKGDGNGS